MFLTSRRSVESISFSFFVRTAWCEYDMSVLSYFSSLSEEKKYHQQQQRQLDGIIEIGMAVLQPHHTLMIDA